MSAFSAQSGSYPIIARAGRDDSPSDPFAVLNHAPGTQATGTRPLRRQPASTRLFGRIAWACSVVATAAALGLMWGLHEDAPRPVLAGLLVTLLLSGMTLAATLLQMLRVQIADRSQAELLVAIEAAKASLKRHMDRVAEERLVGLARLATLDDDMRTRVEAQGRAYTAILEQACRRMAAEMATVRRDVGQIRELVEGELNELVRRVDEQDQAIADLRTIASVSAELVDLQKMIGGRMSAVEAAVAAMQERLSGAEEAMVAIACSAMPATEGKNGNGHKSGLDAEIITLARRISNKINRS